jgi:hypothetical protein
MFIANHAGRHRSVKPSGGKDVPLINLVMDIFAGSSTAGYVKERPARTGSERCRSVDNARYSARYSRSCNNNHHGPKGKGWIVGPDGLPFFPSTRITIGGDADKIHPQGGN